MDCLCFFADTEIIPFCENKKQYNSSTHVNKTNDPRVSNYKHLHVRYQLIFSKRELKPDDDIEKSIQSIIFFFLNPSSFSIFLLNLLCKLILYEMVKFVLD